MTRWTLLAVGFLGGMSFRQEAQADQVAPASGTWVGMDGRTYYVPPAEAPPAAAEDQEEPQTQQLDKHGRPRRKVNVGMAVAGGVFAGLGAMAFVGGLAGYFATIRCQSGSYVFDTTCSDQKEILFVSLAGIVSATAIGTPLLVVGLRRPAKNETEKPAEEASLSFTLGAVSGLSLRF